MFQDTEVGVEPTPLPDNTESLLYNEAKSLCPTYQLAKERLIIAFEKAKLGRWVKKPLEQDQFICELLDADPTALFAWVASDADDMRQGWSRGNEREGKHDYDDNSTKIDDEIWSNRNEREGQLDYDNYSTKIDDENWSRGNEREGQLDYDNYSTKIDDENWSRGNEREGQLDYDNYSTKIDDENWSRGNEREGQYDNYDTIAKIDDENWSRGNERAGQLDYDNYSTKIDNSKWSRGNERAGQHDINEDKTKNHARNDCMAYSNENRITYDQKESVKQCDDVEKRQRHDRNDDFSYTSENYRKVERRNNTMVNSSSFYQSSINERVITYDNYNENCSHVGNTNQLSKIGDYRSGSKYLKEVKNNISANKNTRVEKSINNSTSITSYDTINVLSSEIVKKETYRYSNSSQFDPAKWIECHKTSAINFDSNCYKNNKYTGKESKNNTSFNSKDIPEHSENIITINNYYIDNKTFYAGHTNVNKITPKHEQFWKEFYKNRQKKRGVFSNQNIENNANYSDDYWTSINNNNFDIINENFNVNNYYDKDSSVTISHIRKQEEGKTKYWTDFYKNRQAKRFDTNKSITTQLGDYWTKENFELNNYSDDVTESSQNINNINASTSKISSNIKTNTPNINLTDFNQNISTNCLQKIDNFNTTDSTTEDNDMDRLKRKSLTLLERLKLLNKYNLEGIDNSSAEKSCEIVDLNSKVDSLNINCQKTCTNYISENNNSNNEIALRRNAHESSNDDNSKTNKLLMKRLEMHRKIAQN